MACDVSEDSVQSRLALARAALGAVETRMGADRAVWDTPALPLTESLRPLLPRGLRRGHVVAVEGSTSLLLALAGEASREGAWTAMVGMPSVGVLAAAGRGIDLARLALIPQPGVQAPAVLGACIDGVDIIVIGRGLALSEADRRRLAARARERGCILLVQGGWPAAHEVLTVERSRWTGLGAGEGRLRHREITVAVTGRSAGATGRVMMTLDADHHALPVRTQSPHQAAVDRALGTGAA